MPRPQFSDMLVARRRQLGLSVEQASNVLKIKPQVLIAFEEGDFVHIPKSGYAQGMLASYARYLGMNPREIVDQFCDDLFVYKNGSASHELRRRTRDSRALDDDTSRSAGGTSRHSGSRSQSTRLSGSSLDDRRGSAVGGVPRVTSSYSPDAPSTTTSSPHVRHTNAPEAYNNRYAPSPEPPRSYNSPNRQEESRNSSSSRRQTNQVRSNSAVRSGRMTSPRKDTSAAQVRHRDSRYPMGEDIVTRGVSPQVTDDLRYGQARPYEAASTRSGRQSSRNIAPPNRPNVQRRSPRQNRQYQSQRQRGNQAPRRGGVLGFLENYFSDSRRTIITILAALAIILLVLIIGSVHSCTSTVASTGKEVSVTTATSTTTQATTTTQEQKAAEQQALSDAAASKSAAASTAAVTETDVTVSVSDGSVTWVEITCDGESKVAETVTGPWKQTYVVTQSITVQVGDTSVVSVTNNGTQVQFDAKASGVGSLTIQGTQVATTTDADTTASTTSAASATATTSATS